MNSVVIYSYQFIANSTSYLNAADSSDPVITLIESIGSGRAGGGGWWEAEGRLKQPFRLKEQCCAFSV